MSSSHREPATSAPFFPVASALAAELKLTYAVEQSLEAAVLAAPPGLGKTTLLRRATARAAAAGDVVVDIFYPRLSADELLAFVESELAAEVAPALSSEPPALRLARHIRSLAESDRGVLIAIDDAHLLRDPGIFETLQLLLNLRGRENVRITFLLAGQPALLAALESVPAFAQRIAVTASLAPLAAEETATYVRHRLAVFDDGVTIAEAAIELIQERSGGVPRTIDRLCEMSLLIAQAEDRTRITAADVAAAARETVPAAEAA